LNRDHSHFWEKQQLVRDTGGSLRDLIPFIFRAYNMAPGICKSVLGIRFTKKELIELKKVWNDAAWDDAENDLAEAEETGQFGYSTEREDDEDDEDEEEDDDNEEDEEDEDEEDEELDKGDKVETQDNEMGDESDYECSQFFHETEEQSTPAPGVDKLAELVFCLCIFFITKEFTEVAKSPRTTAGSGQAWKIYFVFIS
jgi:hypothetical protein